MTKEQEKAIRQCKYLLFLYKKEGTKRYRCTADLFDKDLEAIETVLNLIQEQEAEIEELEKALIEEQMKHTTEIEKKDELEKEVAEDIDKVAVELSKLTDNIFIINQVMKLQKIAQEKLGKFYID